MKISRFEDLVQKTLDDLPNEFASLLENVSIVVEQEPSRGLLRRLGMRTASSLYGLYEGVPQTQRTSHYGLVPPDRITIFQRAIERSASSEEEVEKQVRDTVLHEIAHHFGIGDTRLREIEREHNKGRSRKR